MANGIAIGIGFRRNNLWSRYWTTPKFQDGEQFDNGKVVLQFDDGYQNNYTNGLPLFQEKGVKATVFISTDLVGDLDVLGFPALTWSQIQEMHALGMDMQCHGHTGALLTTGTDEFVNSEYTSNNDLFFANGLPQAKHTAYSAGDYNDHTLKITDNYRKTGRTTTAGDVTRKSSKFRMGSDNIQLGVSLPYIKSRMDAALANKTALVLWGHMIGVADALSISVADLEEIIDYGKSIGLDFITTDQLYNQMLYIDLYLSRDCADNAIEIVCKNQLPLSSGARVSIERSDDDGVTYTEIILLESGVDSYTDTGLTLGKNYYYRARGIWKTTNLPYSNIQNVSTAITMTITATGNGSGVGVLRVQSDDKVTISLSGNGRFYTNEAGTLGESTTKKLTKYAQDIYFKCTSGTANLVFPKNCIYQIENYTAAANCPSLGGSITPFSEITYLHILGNNTISGDISKLRKLTNIVLLGTNTLSGSVSDLTLLTLLYVQGSNTLSGSITNLIKLTTINVTGTNTLQGSIANLTLLEMLYITGSSNITGSITNLVSLNYVNLSPNSISGSVANLVLLTNLYIGGSANTLTGDIGNLVNLTKLDVLGNNTLSGSLNALNKLAWLNIAGGNLITGDVKNISAVMTRCYVINGRMDTYTSGGDWSKISAGGTVTIKPVAGYGLSSAEVDLLIQEIAATKVAGRAVVVDLRGSCLARTAASDAARNAIVADGGTVTTNP